MKPATPPPMISEALASPLAGASSFKDEPKTAAHLLSDTSCEHDDRWVLLDRGIVPGTMLRSQRVLPKNLGLDIIWHVRGWSARGPIQQLVKSRLPGLPLQRFTESLGFHMVAVVPQFCGREQEFRKGDHSRSGDSVLSTPCRRESTGPSGNPA